MFWQKQCCSKNEACLSDVKNTHRNNHSKTEMSNPNTALWLFEPLGFVFFHNFDQIFLMFLFLFFLSKFLHFLFFVFNLNFACNTHTDIRNVPTNKGKIDQTNVYISIREKKLTSTFLFNEKGRKLTFTFSFKATEKFLEIIRHPKNYKIWWKLTNVILTLNILL